MQTKNSLMLLFIMLTVAVSSLAAHSANITGTWKAEFQTQVGVQKYIYTLTQDGNSVFGKALSDIGGNKREVDVLEGRLDGDTIRFVEILDFQGSEIRISYKGKVADDEIKLTRQVGEMSAEELVMKRVKSEAASLPASQQRRPQGPGQQIVLGPDDKPAFVPAPKGFDTRREGIARGKIETVEYNSKTVGNKRKMLIYTPPGYSNDTNYPVLYLLHGIGGDEKEWYEHASPEVILDNLYADKKLMPMLVVLPNGRAEPNDRAVGNTFSHSKAFENFEHDLLNDVIPFMESNYPVKKGSENRAIAGLSMGGGQALNFGLGNLNVFAWVGGFSSAPNTKSPEQLVPEPAKTVRRLKLLWISCGDKDGLISFSQSVHVYLKQNKVPHIWHVDTGGHEWPVWKNDLYLFSQLLFRRGQ
jgi:enterochelin esterase-like enzyme